MIADINGLTVGDLKRFLQDCPEDAPVLLFKGGPLRSAKKQYSAWHKGEVVTVSDSMGYGIKSSLNDTTNHNNDR